MKNFIAIVFASIVIAIIYGIVHDQITIRISLEYFTVGHGRIINSDDPTQIAFAWGIRATWWMGLIIGIVVGLFATVGKAPVVTLKDLMIPVMIVLVFVVSYAAISGIVGFQQATANEIILPTWLAERIPEERHQAFIVAWWIHMGSYDGAALGAIFLCIWIVYKRIKGRHKATLLGIVF